MRPGGVNLPPATAGSLTSLPKEQAIEDLIYPTNRRKVSIVPSSPWLAGIDKSLSQEPGSEQILKLKLRKLHPIVSHTFSLIARRKWA